MLAHEILNIAHLFPTEMIVERVRQILRRADALMLLRLR